MDSAKTAPFIGKRTLFMVAAVPIVGVSLYAGFRPAPVAPPPAVVVAADPDAPPADVQLASLQAAFAMSHLGALRDDVEAEPKRAPRTAEKPRAAAPRSAGGVRPATQVSAVTTAPLPPPLPLAPAPQQSKPPPSEPGPSIFGVSLPSPGKWVDGVASLGDSITSLVRWR